MNEFPNLETPRLLLREVQADDSAALFQYYALEEVGYYFLELGVTQEQADAIAAEYRSYYRNGSGIVWAMTLKDNPMLIGTCGYEKISSHDRRGEIGYDLSKAYWGQGLMQEALRAVIAYSFSALNLNRIEAYVFAANTRSLQVLKQLHFTQEGVLREHRWFKGQFWDNVIMALLKKDWEIVDPLS